MCIRDSGTTFRTVEIDEERAAHVRWAFQQYALGEWSDRDIQEALADRGLRTKPTRKRPSCELSRSRVAGMLGNPYYVGIVRFRGASYPGTHEPLIAADLFDRVQEIRRAHDVAGTRRLAFFHTFPWRGRASGRCPGCRRLFKKKSNNSVSARDERQTHSAAIITIAQIEHNMPH